MDFLKKTEQHSESCLGGLLDGILTGGMDGEWCWDSIPEMVAGFDFTNVRILNMSWKFEIGFAFSAFFLHLFCGVFSAILQHS